MFAHSVRRTFGLAVMALACLCAPGMGMAQANASNASPDARLQQRLQSLAQRVRPATLGVAVLDLSSGASAGVNAGQAFPMMSVFKAPVAAAVLARVDAGTMSLQQKVTITRDQVLEGSAIPSIGSHFRGERMTFTVEQLLKAAVSESDNTAVDALIRTLGGPSTITAYLRAHGIDGMHVDMDEAGVAQVFEGLRPGETESTQESGEAVLRRRELGYQAFLADPRNRSTPDAAVAFLRKLARCELLSPASTQRLLALMHAQTVPNRLRAGIPGHLRFADKTGTSGSFAGRTAAYNDIGIVSWPDGRQVLIAAFLLDSRASDAPAALYAEIARSIVGSVHPGP